MPPEQFKFPIPNGETNSAETQNDPETRELDEIYGNSEILKMLDKRAGKGRIALFTDIDNTFFRQDREAVSKKIAKKTEEENIPIIAVTGNDFGAVLKRIESGELPYFQAIAGSVGTEIWILGKNQEGKPVYKKDTYFEKMLKDSGFERRNVASKAKEMIEELKTKFADAELNFQIPEKEKELEQVPDPNYQPFKVSFHFYSDQESLENIFKEVKKYFPDFQIIVCEEIGYSKNLPPNETRKKYCLDIVPISKAGAADYLVKTCSVENGIVSGDSGNDIDMLVKTGKLNAVLVGGYKPEAKAGIDKEIKTQKKGKMSFRKIIMPDGTIKAIYTEQKAGRLGPESILRAAEILERAEKIKKIREGKKITGEYPNKKPAFAGETLLRG